MENASKALLMVGGILIGLILLSLGVYLYGVMREAEQTRVTLLTEEQLVKYNQEYISYDKGAMYGTDVVTVLNKAISNNEFYSDDESMFIDVKFELLDDVSTVVNIYTWNKNEKKYELNKIESDKLKKKSAYGFSKGKKYSLLNESDIVVINKFLVDGPKESTNKKENLSSSESKRLTVDNHEPYKITYSGFSDFKRMIFKCVKVGYNSIGKVNYMEFKQIKASEYN